jgi:hypothetical protein
MDVELLVTPECPNETAARDLLRTALDDVGLTRVPVVTSIVGSVEDAARRGFTGSPTILINGRDPFVAADQSGLACRIYTIDGTAHGIPDVRDLRRALKQAAAGEAGREADHDGRARSDPARAARVGRR